MSQFEALGDTIEIKVVTPQNQQQKVVVAFRDEHGDDYTVSQVREKLCKHDLIRIGNHEDYQLNGRLNDGTETKMENSKPVTDYFDYLTNGYVYIVARSK